MTYRDICYVWCCATWSLFLKISSCRSSFFSFLYQIWCAVVPSPSYLCPYLFFFYLPFLLFHRNATIGFKFTIINASGKHRFHKTVVGRCKTIAVFSNVRCYFFVNSSQNRRFNSMFPIPKILIQINDIFVFYKK